MKLRTPPHSQVNQRETALLIFGKSPGESLSPYYVQKNLFCHGFYLESFKSFQSSLFSEQVLAPLLWHIFPMGFLLFSEKEICKQNFEKATSPKYWCSSVIIVIFIIQHSARFQGTIFPAFLQWSRSPRNVMQIDYSESFQIFSRKQP